MKILKKSVILSLVAMSSLHAADSLSTAFSEGKASGQLRAYYMDEDNQAGLQDYYGLAVGGKLKYETAPLFGFKAGVAFYTTNFINDNVSSTNIEPTAGKGSRYVAGLVDAENQNNNNITNIGELYLNYKKSKTEVTFGRMKLNTPFINPEDGRMIPTLEQGVWFKSADIKDFVLQAGFINAFWNRSTSSWKGAADSLGYGYLQGKASLPGSTNANYKGHTSTDGVYVASAEYSGLTNTKLAVWDYYVENIFNTIYLQGDYEKKVDKFKFIAAAQYVGQQEVGDGGNGADNIANPTAAQKAESYMLKGEKSNTYGAKVGAGYDSTLLTLAVSKTTDEGRFLFPREWGKEPLFTFQKRERSDGSGDTSAWLLTLDQDFKVIGLNGLSATLGYGRYYKPDAKNFVLNKYGVPSYAQTNLDIFYKFSGSLKGLSLEYLFARKYALGNTYQTSALNTGSAFVFTKNDMNIHNFIVNYDF